MKYRHVVFAARTEIETNLQFFRQMPRLGEKIST
jgi:hypothetical protein